MLNPIPNDDHYLALTWIVSLGLQTVCFVIAYTLQFDKVRGAGVWGRCGAARLWRVVPRGEGLGVPQAGGCAQARRVCTCRGGLSQPPPPHL